MRLNYRILWIENDFSWQESTEKMIKDEITESGFVLEIFPHKNYKDLNILSKKFPNFKTFDLILIDFKLDNDLTGDTFIREVRKNNIFTDILFYSKDSEKLQEVFMNNSLEGVYISNREDFEEKFFQVYRKTIKKFEEINAVRGMVMAETSRLDRIIEDIIISFMNSDNANSQRLKEYIIKLLEDNTKSLFVDNEKKINERGNLKAKDAENKKLIKRILDASKRSRTLMKLINNEKLDVKFTYEKYKKNVIDIRNDLAHAKSETIEGIEYLIIEENGTVEKKELKTEDIVEIRKNILDYDKILNEIKERL
ncbi:MAG: hypothetical protein K8R58_12705 [Bacteroidales bacterium]|nr:hypothetical protein [Bacteroidales bacterium]